MNISLLQVHNAVSLQGIVELNQLSRQLQAPATLVQALLEQLVRMQKIEVVTNNGCATGQCKGCPQGQRCQTSYFRFIR